MTCKVDRVHVVPDQQSCWVSQQGRQKEQDFWLPNLPKFYYPEKGQGSSPKSSRLSSQLLGWAESKRFPKITWVWVPNIMWQRQPWNAWRNAAPRELIFTGPQQVVWPKLVLDDYVQGQETRLFPLCGSPLQFLKLESSCRASQNLSPGYFQNLSESTNRFNPFSIGPHFKDK